MYNEVENINRIEQTVKELLSRSDKGIYIIIDGDRTLIPTDSTKFFFNYLNLSFLDIKTIFQTHGYSFKAFQEVALFYSKIDIEEYNKACIFSANSVEIYPEFLSFIHAVKDFAELILITSGIRQNWQNVLNRYSLDFIHLFGGNYYPHDSFVIDKNAKGMIARTLRQSNRLVFAFGDTLIDFDMLRDATHPYLVVNEKLNWDIIPMASDIKHLKQVSFFDYHHPQLPLTNMSEIFKIVKSCYHQ